MDNEQWRRVTIPEFTNLYEVSNNGRVRSLDRADHPMTGSGVRIKWSRNFVGKELAAKPNARGYPSVYLRNSPAYRNVGVHRLVALAFIPNPDNLPEVNHIDTVKTNNVWTNLEWISRLGNHNHAVNAGLRMACVRKLTDSDVGEIIRRGKAGCPYADLALEFNVNRSTISRLVAGLRRAKHLT